MGKTIITQFICKQNLLRPWNRQPVPLRTQRPSLRQQQSHWLHETGPYLHYRTYDKPGSAKRYNLAWQLDCSYCWWTEVCSIWAYFADYWNWCGDTHKKDWGFASSWIYDVNSGLWLSFLLLVLLWVFLLLYFGRGWLLLYQFYGIVVLLLF